MNVNPITRLDYPDPDVIRVEDTYYMISTTMHFMPGCEILQSFDLVHWEHAAFVYEKPFFSISAVSRQLGARV